MTDADPALIDDATEFGTDPTRAALLKAILPHVPLEGWSDRAVEVAARETEVTLADPDATPADFRQLTVLSAVAIWTRPNEAYLLTLNGYCPDLEFATAISLTHQFRTVYARFDRVVPLGSPFRW